MNDRRDDGVNADAILDLRKDKGTAAPHGNGIALHHAKIRSDSLGEIGFIDDKQIGLRNTRATFARNLIAARNVNHINAVIGQLSAEVGGKIVSA
jgi:hypothetical protein